MTPKFEKYYDKFLGHYHGYDIYIRDGCLTARWGNKQGQYEVCRVDTLLSHFSNREFISKEIQEHYIAMLLALTHMKVKEI